MKRFLQSDPLHCNRASALPVAAQTPPTQGWPANRPADQSAPAAKPPQATQTPPAAKPQATTATPGPGPSPAPPAAGTPPPVPLPQWFVEIDTDKKGEVTRAEFLKYRMKSFEELDANKDGKLTIEEFLKVAEPPFSQDVPNGPTLEERQQPGAGRVPEPRHQSRRLRRARRGRGAGPFRVQPVRH